MRYEEDDMKRSTIRNITVTSIVAFVLLVCLMMWGCPRYNVYSSELSGKAQLAQANANREIKVREAEALRDSASLLAEADILRAGGVAESQKIINDTLTDRYIRWLQAESISEQECEIRYVPTEAQLPILEAREKPE